MRNKSFLSLMEQICMIAVFAVATSICLYGFSLAHNISKERSTLDAAVLLAQDTCEMLKHAGGDTEKAAESLGASVDGSTLSICYDENKKLTDEASAAFVVKAVLRRDASGLGTAEVTVYANGEAVYSLTTAWQEAEYES